MSLVAGIDSSTQSCKVSVRDLTTGEQVRVGRADHPLETIVHPDVWWDALLRAVADTGGLEDVVALSVSGQQHTPIFLGADGDAVCDSPLWNDTGSHPHMMALNAELGRTEWIRRTGLPLTLSDTVTKLRWLRDTDLEAVKATAGVAIVHDWLTWRLRGFGPGSGALDELVTDRSDACGTGYWDPTTNRWLPELFELAFGKQAVLPRILDPRDRAGVTASGIPGIPAGIPIGVGGGDNAAAALALAVAPGDAVMSLGTSGVVYTSSAEPVHDLAGYVCNYADATGGHQPIVATLNAARNFHAGARLLGCTHAELSDLALQAPPGAQGLTLLPFFEGERTPDLPHARASLQQASLANFTRENFARAVFEGTLASQVAMLDALRACDLPVDRLLLIGGAAQSAAVHAILPQLVDVPLLVPEADEYVTKGAAMQAACALTGDFPDWSVGMRELPAVPREPAIGAQREEAMEALGYCEV
jgi:xylulokinase